MIGRVWIVFITAMLALLLYVGLALRGVALWALLPFLAYSAWAQFWLMTSPKASR